MIDKEQIGIMIKDINRYFAELETIRLDSKKDLEIPEKKNAVSMLVFSIINRVIDISNELIAGSALSVPASYQDTFVILKNAKLISSDVAEKMVWLMKYRNIIAHQYYVLGADEIYQIRKRIYEVEQFLSEIKRHLK